MKRTAVINVVGLTESLLGPNTRRASMNFAAGAARQNRPRFPPSPAPRNPLISPAKRRRNTASSATAGITANWPKSNSGNNPTTSFTVEKSGTELRERDPGFTCAKFFWWFNMYSSADYSITPRPMYPADGRKFFDIYTWPYSIRAEIKKDLGEFPFPCFWGPAAGVNSPQGAADAASRWIAESAKWIENKYRADAESDLPAASRLQFATARAVFVAADVRRLTQMRGEGLGTSPPEVGCYQSSIPPSFPTCARLTPSSAT